MRCLCCVRPPAYDFSSDVVDLYTRSADLNRLTEYTCDNGVALQKGVEDHPEVGS